MSGAHRGPGSTCAAGHAQGVRRRGFDHPHRLVVAFTLHVPEPSSPGVPPKKLVKTTFAVNVFPTSVSGDWEKLRDPARMDTPDADLAIELTSVSKDGVEARIAYGNKEVLRATYAMAEGPDLNVFDYSSEGTLSATTEAARCSLPPRTVDGTKMTFKQVGQFLDRATLRLFERPLQVVVWLSAEVSHQLL
jgi:hypothetical protein